MPMGDQHSCGVMGPAGRLQGSLDDERHALIQIIGHRRVSWGQRRLARTQELHQRQTEAFARRGIHVVIGGRNHGLVLVVLEETVQDDHPAGEGRQAGKQRHQHDPVMLQVVVGHLHQQHRIGRIAESPTEGGDQVDPVLPAVGRVEDRGVNHTLNLDVTDGRRYQRRRTARHGFYRAEYLPAPAVEQDPADFQPLFPARRRLRGLHDGCRLGRLGVGATH